MQRSYHPRNSNRRGPVVEDLREKLNRIKQEKSSNAEGTKNPPPPDPAYNFLKDPLRGDNCTKLVSEKKVGNKDQNIKHEAKYESKSNDAEQKNPSKPCEKVPRENRNANFGKNSGTPRGWERQNWGTHMPRDGQQPRKWKDKTVPQPSTKQQQSVNNIKVILSNESGERKCTIDETVLVQIPVIAGNNYVVKPKPEKWSRTGAQKHYYGKNKQMFAGENKGKNEEDTDKQLQTDIVNENKNKSISLNETDQKTEMIANNNADESVISKETSQIIVTDNKTDPINEEQKPAETTKENDFQSTPTQGDSKASQE